MQVTKKTHRYRFQMLVRISKENDPFLIGEGSFKINISHRDLLFFNGRLVAIVAQI